MQRVDENDGLRRPSAAGRAFEAEGAAVTMSELRRSVENIPAPTNFFSGVHIRSSLAPDNIVFFRRTQKTEFQPQEVINNYHHRFELFVVIENGGKVRVGEGTYLMEERESFLVFPNQFHAYMDVEHAAIDWLFITFNLHQAERVETLRNSPRKLTASGMAWLERLVHAYVYPAHDGPDGLQIAYLLSRFLEEMLRSPLIAQMRRNPAENADNRAAILERINTYVRDNLDKALSIGDLASALGYSVSYLRLVFREQLGVSLGKYIRESRLSEAAQLLQDPKLKVTDIARRCGFESLYVFSRAFKKTYGIPPKDYSKMLQRLPAPPAPSEEA